MASDGKVTISTELENGKLAKGIAQVKGQLGGLDSVVKKLGATIATAFSVKVLVDFAKGCIELGSDLQEVQNVVDVTFTMMNEQVNEFAKNAAKTAGLSETMAKRYAGTFGAMAKSFKFTEKEAYTMATTLTQLSGDVASFYNLTQDETYTKLKSVFTGETESLKDLGVVMTQTALDSFALAKGLDKTTSQMTEQEKVALRYQFVMEQLSGATGDFVRTSDSWANQTKLLNLQWEQLKATLGQGLINVLIPVLKLLNSLISKLQEAANAFKSFTDGLFGKTSESTESVVENVAAGFEAATENTKQLENELKSAKRQLAGFDELNIIQKDENKNQSSAALPVVGLATGNSSSENTQSESVFEQRLKKTFETVKDFAEKIKTAFAPAAEAWGKTGESIAASIEKNIPQIADSMNGIINGALIPFANYVVLDFIPSIANDFSTTFAPIFADLMPAAIEIFTKSFKNAEKLVKKVVNGLKKVFEGVKTAFHDMCGSISENWAIYGESLIQGFKDFADSVWDLFWGLYENVLEPVFSSWGETISWLWDQHLKPLWDNIVSFVMSVSDNIMSLWNGFLAPLVNWIVELFGPPIAFVLSTIGDAFGVMFGIISDVAGGVLTTLKGLVEFITGVFTRDWEKAWQGVVNLFSGIFSAVGGIVNGVVNGVIATFNFIIGSIYKVIATVVNVVGSVTGAIGKVFGQDWGFGMDVNDPPQIPYLAKGAVLPPNKPFLAMVGDQKHGTNIEAPLSTIQEAVALVMDDYAAANLAGHEATVGVLREILEAILGIQIGDEVIGQAIERYNQRMAIIKGGL